MVLYTLKSWIETYVLFDSYIFRVFIFRCLLTFTSLYIIYIYLEFVRNDGNDAVKNSF